MRIPLAKKAAGRYNAPNMCGKGLKYIFIRRHYTPMMGAGNLFPVTFFRN
jgi:hypothetical protein